MTKNFFDELGDRVKSFEAISTDRRAIKGEYIIARLDGQAFHSFTKGLQRPIDPGFRNLMIETTKHLVSKFHAKLGYTQSDEITLVLYEPADSESEFMYSGRFQKLDSSFAASASVHFNKLLPSYLSNKRHLEPTFDARTFSVPHLKDVYETFLWRQLDCAKNAVSMAAQSMFSHKQLQGKGSKEMIAMMEGKGLKFSDFPASFRRGTFVHRVVKEVTLTDEQLANIPEAYRNQSKTCLRSVVEPFDWWMPKKPAAKDLEKLNSFLVKKGVNDSGEN